MPRGSQGRGPIRVEGLVELQRDLKKFAPAVQKKCRARMRKAVNVIVGNARRRAPKRTGRLVKGIKAQVTNKGAALVSKAPHARISEYGGRHPVHGDRETWVFHPARPHVGPAVDAGRDQVTTESIGAVNDAKREAGL